MNSTIKLIPMLCLLVILLIIARMSYCDGGEWLLKDIGGRKLTEFHPVVDRGNSALVRGKTVFAALLHVSVPSKDISMTASHHELSAQQRKTHEWLTQHLPMPVVVWPNINSKSCPVFQSTQESHNMRHGHFTSQLLSHFQVWSDWVFVDHDVLGAVTRNPPEYVSSSSYSSISGHFQAYPNLTYTKNEVPLRDQDALWVFDDNLVVDRMKAMAGELHTKSANATAGSQTTSQLREAIQQHVNSLDQYDIVQLHSCNSTATDGAGSRSGGAGEQTPPPSAPCPYVYAITRRGARVLTDEIELCVSRSLESQMQSLEVWGHLKVLRLYGNHIFEYHTQGAHVGVVA